MDHAAGTNREMRLSDDTASGCGMGAVHHGCQRQPAQTIGRLREKRAAPDAPLKRFLVKIRDFHVVALFGSFRGLEEGLDPREFIMRLSIS